MSSSTSAKRPIEITDFKEVIRDLPDSQLQQIRAELTNSISHLDRSNSRLRKYIAKIEGKREDTPDGVEEDELDKIDENDLQLYQDSHRENEIVMRNYNERLDALDQEEAYRGGHVKTKDIGASPQTGIASQKKPRAPSFDTDNTNGDTNAPNSCSPLLTMWSGLLLHWCGVLSVLAKPSTSKNIIQLPRSSDRSSISLVCRAKKVSRIHEMPPHAYTTCIGFSAEDALVQNTRAEELIGLSLLIDVQNSLPYEVDLTRLGPKSIGSRKQSLDLEITDTAGNLLRARRNVPRGKTGIWLQPPATGTPLLNVCFTNLVYDASWRTIDMDKIATITVLGPGGHRWSEDVLADDSSKDLLQGIVLHTRALAEDKRIVQTEESHRDINENTLELYTRGQTIIMITHFLLELGISYYIRHLVKQRIRRARHR